MCEATALMMRLRQKEEGTRCGFSALSQSKNREVLSYVNSATADPGIALIIVGPMPVARALKR